MTALDDMVWVTLIGDADTPAQFQSYIGKVIGVPPGTPLPTFPSEYRLAGALPGYARPSLVSPTPMEWIITAAVDSLLLALNTIPGPQGFTRAQSKTDYVALAVDMRRSGLTRSAILAGLTTAYRSAVADYQAAVAATPPP